MKRLNITNKTAKIIAWIAGITAILLTITMIVLANKFESVTMTESELQAKLEPHIPFKENFKKGMLGKTLTEGAFTVSKVDLDLKSNKINIIATAQAETRGYEVKNITISCSGTPKLKNKKVYFKPSEIEISDIKFSTKNIKTRARDKIAKNLLKKLKKHEIFEGLTDQDFKSLGKDLSESSLQSILGKISLYEIKGAKGWVVNALVKDIEIKEDSITIHLSFWQLTKSFIIFVLAAVFCGIITFALVRSGAGDILLIFCILDI